ncbi:MAG: xanthine dehydrogenase family protein molybdopterin-binding subunit, partial [Candidatus Binataceae bacterium]
MEGDRAKLVGQRIKRVEDRRLLTGGGSYVADYNPAGLLHIAFLRAQDAHARIAGIDASAARKIPGVIAVITGAELAAVAKPMRALSTMPSYKTTSLPAMAVEKVRYVGEAVAAVVADSRYVAEDALDHIAADYEPLAPVSDMEAAIDADAPLLHDEAGTNVLVTREFARGDVDAAFGNAALVVKDRFRFHRHTAMCMEPRGYCADYNHGARLLTLRSATQSPGLVRSALAEMLGLGEHQVRVIAGDVGGGFGSKGAVYAEEIAVAAIARMLGRTVRWISDRREDLLATSQAWDEIIDAELAVAADGTFLALKADVIADVGAYSVYPWTAVVEPVQTVSFMPGPYRIQDYRARARAVATNKAATGPYRGVGRPVAAFVMESLVDRAARQLGFDPGELRLRNFIRTSEFPYKTPTGIVWDRADFGECLKKARDMIGYDAARAQQARAREEGRFVGIGFATYVELTGIGSATPAAPGMPVPAGTEAATVRIDPAGTVTAFFGVHSHGQGLETSLAQVIADELDVPLEDVRIVYGDTAQVPYGTGSYASRAATLGGGAAILASRDLRNKARRIAAHLLETAPDENGATDGEVWARTAPGHRVSLRQIAQAAYYGIKRLPKGMEPGLEVTRFYDPFYGTATSATHAVMVEIDRGTCAVKILRYVVAEDCGRVINPLIVDGQVRGGVAQGVGAALMEEIVYDENGQLLTGTLMDYTVPSAVEIPRIEAHHVDTVSPTTLGGFRGVGESGTIGAP